MMARIRTVKPDFFTHEELQDLESKHPGKYPMFVFQGLWTISDSKGRFKYKPRSIKLQVLPFLDFDMAETLTILEQAGYIQVYEVDGEQYGLVKTFEKHQRITGKEATEGEKYPPPTSEAQGSNQGNNGETSENNPDAQEEEREKEGKGKGKEEERIGENPAPPPPEIPATFQNLTEYFVNQQKFRFEVVHSAKVVDMLKSWVKAGATMEDVTQAVIYANAKNKGRPNNPLYYHGFLEDVLKAKKNPIKLDTKSGQQLNGGNYATDKRLRQQQHADIAAEITSDEFWRKLEAEENEQRTD
jgi:hypothetical protein